MTRAGLLLLPFALAACAAGAGASGLARRIDDRPLPGPEAEGSPAIRPVRGQAEALRGRMTSAHDRHGRGRPAATALVAGELGVGAEQGFTVELVGGVCYSLLAVGENDDADIDLLLLDPLGTEVAEDRRPGAGAVVEICPPRSGRYRAVVRMYAGGGAFAFQLFGA